MKASALGQKLSLLIPLVLFLQEEFTVIYGRFWFQ